MNKRVCENCGNEFYEFLEKCPNCNKEDKEDSIIFNDDLSIKEDIINKRNQSIKNINKKKQNNSLYSYLLLVMGMILLFIIIFSTILEFSMIPFVHYILTVLFLFLSFSLTFQENDIGYYTAILASISMIFMIYERDYISALIGVYIFTSSFRCLIKK